MRLELDIYKFNYNQLSNNSTLFFLRVNQIFFRFYTFRNTFIREYVKFIFKYPLLSYAIIIQTFATLSKVQIRSISDHKIKIFVIASSNDSVFKENPSQPPSRLELAATDRPNLQQPIKTKARPNECSFRVNSAAGSQSRG